MDTLNLKAFLCVARNGSFSLAAEQLHLTQPAVSKRVSLLEQHLGTRLFDRIGRRVTVTQAGLTLLPLAEDILQRIEKATQNIQDLSGKIKGKFRLVTSHHIGLHRLPTALRSYTSLYPDVEIDVQFQNSDDAISSIVGGDFDMGLVSLPTEIDPRIDFQSIWYDKLHVVVADLHPLSQLKNVSLIELSNYPAMLPDRKIRFVKEISDIFLSHNLTLNILLSTNYLETIKAMISVGYAWGVLPETMLDDDRLVIIPVSDLSLGRELGCIFHRNKSFNNPARAFLELLESTKNQ